MTTPSDVLDVLAAAKAGDAPAVARLLAASPRLVRAKDRWQNTPLHEAADAAVARLLVEHGADVNADGWMGATPLHRAAQHGRADVAELLIRHGADVHARRSERRDAPLHWAATEAVACLLVEHGADVEARDEWGRTPLHWAGQFGYAGTAQYLLASGADVNARAERTPRKASSQSPSGTRLLSRAMTALGLSADPPGQNAGGVKPQRYTRDTPLHEAAREGRTAVVEVLLASGAEVNALNNEGWTPLHNAAFRGQHDVIERLVRAGADPHLRTIAGQTPLHVAQRQETKDLLLRLTPSAPPADAPLAVAPARLGLSIRRILIHPTRREALVIAHDAALSRWALDAAPRMIAGMQTQHPWVTDVAVLPDGDEFLAATPEGVEVRRWDNLRVTAMFEPQEERCDRPTAVDASADGRWIAVAEHPEQVVLLERSTRRITGRVEGGERTMSVRFSPDLRRLAAACSFQGGGHVRLDDIGPDGQLTRERELERSVYNTPASRFVDTLARVRFSPDGQHLVLFETSAICHDSRPSGWRGDVVLYHVGTGREVWSASIDAGVTHDGRSLAAAGHAMGFITDVLFAAEGRMVACGATAGVILFFATADGSLLGRSVVHERATVTALAYDPATRLVWAGLESGEIVSTEIPAEGRR
jgi:ankyrin repeat protein